MLENFQYLKILLKNFTKKLLAIEKRVERMCLENRMTRFKINFQAGLDEQNWKLFTNWDYISIVHPQDAEKANAEQTNALALG